jgi:hypothetical protein
VQEGDRKAFDEILAEIFAAIDKPLGEAQRSVFWKALKDMSILEFARCRDQLVTDFREMEDPPRKFTIGDIWRARKKLRATAPSSADSQPKWDGDVWDQVANQQLLRHITTRIPADPGRYGHRSSQQFAENIRAFVAMKNRWASLMREAAGPDGVPAIEQRQCWDSCIRMAEEAMAAEKAA